MRPSLAAAAALLVSGLLLLGSGCGERGVDHGSDRGGPVILISIDTLRADHLPIYGATGVKTPTLDALAADSIVFDEAWSQVPLTFPSHASVLTGRLPADDGVRNNLGYRFDPAMPSIPTLLSAHGYQTGAAVSAYVLRGATGLAGAFDHYDDEMERSEGAAVGDIQRHGDATIRAATDWMDSHSGQPFFLFVHLFEPHAPYEPPEPFRTEYASSPYDGEIAAADHDLAALIDDLRQKNLYDDATIIFMSDHGEGLGDHGESQHGIFLYREAIHVPLFLKLPRNEMAGRRISTPVALTDILPTVASIAGIAIDDPKVIGTSLVEIARGATPDRKIFSETMYPRIHLGWSDLASLVDDRFHYIEAPTPELYDESSDPAETQNVLADNRRVYAAMKKEMATHDRSLTAPTDIDPEDLAKLTALGYLGGTHSTKAGENLPDPKDHIADLERYMAASTLVREDRAGEAIGTLQEITRNNPAFADAWTVLAKAYQQTGQLEQAVDAYQKTIEAAPMLAPGTALSLAEVLLDLNRYDDALHHAELALEAHPSAARIVRARAFLGLHRPAEAERELQPVLDDPSTRLDGNVVLVQVRIEQRRYPEALAISDQVREAVSSGNLEPVPMLWFVRGDVLARLGRTDEAKQSFRDEIARFPRDREAYIRLGALSILEGDLQAADRAFTAMTQANPSPSSYALIAQACRSLGQPERARAWEKRGKGTDR